MFSIKNQLFVSIKVNNTVLPLGGGQLDELIITETVNQFLPTIEFSFIDQFGLLFSNPSIHDGKVISVAIATNQSDLESSWKEYIVYPRRVRGISNGFHVSVVGFLNVPRYYLGGSYGAYSGNSSDVATKISSEVGLSPVVDSSNDNQTWLMTGQSRAKFLRGVCDFAYSNRKSAYICFVNRNRELNFIDISKRRSANPKWIFQVVSSEVNVKPDDQITILCPETSFSCNFASDILNSAGGYGIVYRQFDFNSGTDKLSTLDEYVPFTKYLNVNSNIKGTRFEYMTPDVGNTHKNYAAAKFQNFRNRALYSTSVVVGTSMPRLANLFDRVKLLYYDKPTRSTGSVLDGAYFIERIVQTISESSFVVNYGLIREGINSNTAITELE